jgi:hypothetical protein
VGLATVPPLLLTARGGGVRRRRRRGAPYSPRAPDLHPHTHGDGDGTGRPSPAPSIPHMRRARWGSSTARHSYSSTGGRVELGTGRERIEQAGGRISPRLATHPWRWRCVWWLRRGGAGSPSRRRSLGRVLTPAPCARPSPQAEEEQPELDTPAEEPELGAPAEETEFDAPPFGSARI